MVSERWKWIGAHLGILKKTLVLNLTLIVKDLSPNPNPHSNPKLHPNRKNNNNNGCRTLEVDGDTSRHPQKDLSPKPNPNRERS